MRRIRQNEQKLNEKESMYVYVGYETKRGIEITLQIDMRNGDVHIYDEMGEEVVGLYEVGIEDRNEKQEINSIINAFSTIALNPRFTYFLAD